MNRSVLTAIGIVAAAVIIVSMSTFYMVDQRKQALVLQFGKPVRVVQEPGLKMKIPFVQDVTLFDRRLLDFDADAQEVIMADQKRLVVDAFARYRIVDPLRFFQTVGTEANMRARLSAIVIASTRNVLGQVPFAAVLTAKRADLMRQISDLVVGEATSFGIEVLDVRIMRADLHPDNSPAIFARMQTEREREAKQERAEGSETAQRIRAEAERDRTITLADAQRQAQILRGQGDADATRIFAEAFNLDGEFYAFYRSLQAYRQALTDGSATLVLTPDSEFFRFFREMRGTVEGGTPAGTPRGPVAPVRPATPRQ
ncbi:MAG: protease modulator HflC [Rhodospirillales bacterium]|nr:protease modulator HflC [Rhodospirillales bacterium]